MSTLKPMTVRIRDMENVLYEGQAERISSFNEMGPFDVYPMHANFISIIKKNIILYKDHKKIKEMPVEQAILKVKQDVAHIFVGIEAFAVDDISSTPAEPKKK